VRDTLRAGEGLETRECASTTNTSNPSRSTSSFWIDPEYSDDFVRVLYPTAGFLSTKSLRELTSNSLQLEPSAADDDPQPSLFNGGGTPLMYQGWWPADGGRERQYLYAPNTLVVAQCLWNAAQVLQLFLLIALYHNHGGSYPTNSKTKKAKKTVVNALVASSVCLLPFSVYIISSGGHVFAGLALASALFALLACREPTLRVAVEEDDDGVHTHQEQQQREECALNALHGNDDDNGDDDDNSGNNGNNGQQPWLIVREETVACLANVCSHMYNGRKPWWDIYAWIDSTMGWKHGGDVTPKAAFAPFSFFFSSKARIPLFVSQANRSTAHARVFLVLWSVIPFLYVAYFGVMYLLAVRSPRVGLQRALCIFGMINFLFLTDGVAYRYGRGYRSPYEDLLHWWEHFAWRVAILLPLYQNCTNGHWATHPTQPWVGKILPRVAAVYGVFFLIFQVVQCDVFSFVTFLVLGKEWTFFEWLGWDDHPVVVVLNLNTPKSWATMIMSVVYFALHFSGYPLFRVTLHGERGFAYEQLPPDEDHDRDRTATEEIQLATLAP